MREIKFRGKAKNRKETWFYGDLRRADGITWIFPSDEDAGYDKHQIFPDTIGQFTGIYDSDGVEIYEGDKVEYVELFECHSDAVTQFGVEPQNNYQFHEVYTEIKEGIVYYENGSFRVNNILLGDIKNFRRIWNVIFGCACTGSLDLNLTNWIREDKGTDIQKYKERLKHLKVMSKK